jgi:hypothetical protein
MMANQGLLGVDYKIESDYSDTFRKHYKLTLFYDSILYDERRNYCYYFTLRNNRIFSTRISFTALSSIFIHSGFVISDSLDLVEIAFPEGNRALPKTDLSTFEKGEPVALVDRIDFMNKSKMTQRLIRTSHIKDFDLLRIQSINVDFINTKDRVFYRLSCDPITQAGIYDARMATKWI